MTDRQAKFTRFPIICLSKATETEKRKKRSKAFVQN